MDTLTFIFQMVVYFYHVSVAHVSRSFIIHLPTYAICYFLFSGEAADSNVTTKIHKGKFREVISSSGDPEAENTLYVSAPGDLQAGQIYDEIKIQDR